MCSADRTSLAVPRFGAAERDAGPSRGTEPPFEWLASQLAVRLLDHEPRSTEAAIPDSLKELAAWLGSERASVTVFADDGRTLRSGGCYLAPGLSAEFGETHATGAMSFYLAEARAGRRVLLPHVPYGLPAQATADRGLAAALGLKSTLALPLQAGGEVLGALQVDHFSVPCDWPPQLVSRLELLATLFAGALHRGRAQVRLQETRGELEQTRAALDKSVERLRDMERRLEPDAAAPEPAPVSMAGFTEIVGTSAPLVRVLAQVAQVAETDAPVLVLGETGTGKELVARAVHARSRRQGRPLLTINCAALPATLVESELFGYERGAFTGATQRTLGRFEVAHGGTLLLDEIGELPLGVQAKLLRVLQTGEFERLGSSRTIRTDVRLIAATNRDLDRERREGSFRADLFYRLSVFPIALPPLRERPEDIPLLVWRFITRRQATLGRAVKQVPDALMRALVAYPWPGNVRELENVIERALILTTGSTLAADPAILQSERSLAGSASGSTLAEAERTHIRAVLDECGWRVSGKGNAAERLGLTRSTLQFRMKKLGIERPQSRAPGSSLDRSRPGTAGEPTLL